MRLIGILQTGLRRHGSRAWALALLGCMALAACAGGLLPRDWPLKQLKLPSGSKPLSQGGARQAVWRYTSTANSPVRWEVPFTNEMDWPALGASFDTQMGAMCYIDVTCSGGGVGFFAQKEPKPPCTFGKREMYGYAHIYASRDNRYTVALYNATLLGRAAGDKVGEKAYVMAVYDHAPSQEAAAAPCKT
jgi:hypothetical protein